MDREDVARTVRVMSTEPWVVVVVRSWPHEEGRVIRLTMTRPDQRVPVVAYESSPDLAGELLARWLGDLGGDAAADATTTPDRRPTRPRPPSVARHRGRRA
jgi:hypothetical protein